MSSNLTASANILGKKEMPTLLVCAKPSDIDPRRWQNCLKTVSDEMIASGWNKHAKKFTEVKIRKARKLFYKH